MAWGLGAIGVVAAIIVVTIEILPINSAGRRAPAPPQAVAPLLRSAEQAVSPSLQAASEPPVEPRSPAPSEGEPRVQESAGSEGPGDREARPRNRAKGASASPKGDSQLPQGSRLGVPFARGAPVTGGGTTLDARRALEARPRTLLHPASRPPGTARPASQTLDVTRRAVVRVMAFHARAGRAGDGGRTVRSGFGFVVNENGIVLTVGRFVAGATNVAVVLPDGRTIPVTTIAIDPLNDLAVLQVEAGRLWAVPLGTSGTLRMGDPVFALGSPAVGETVGTVRATGTATGGDLVAVRPTGQLRAGLPLLNERGEAVGIVVRTSAAGSGTALDVAVPIDRAKRLLRDLGPTAPRDFGWEITSDR